MLTEMENMREQMQTEINQESMAKEENHSRAAWLLKVTLKQNLDI